MTAQVAPHIRFGELVTVLLRAVAILAPLSAAQYAWITLRKVQTQSETAELES
jgi:hypothetical protein